MNAKEKSKELKEYLKSIDVSFSISFIGEKKYFPEDKETRNVYALTLTSNSGAESFRYGDSIQNTKDGRTGRGHPDRRPAYFRKDPTIGNYRPPLSDILYCLISDYSAGEMSLDAFADEFGYNDGSHKISEIMRIHKAVEQAKIKLDAVFLTAHIGKIQEILQDY